MLQTKELSFSYNDGGVRKNVLDCVDTQFKNGVFYSILGRSGSGKTTLLAMLSALDTPESGDVYIDEQSIQKIGLAKYRRSKIGIVFQNFHLIPYMNAIQNVMVAMGISKSKSKRKQKALEILSSLGIDEEKSKRSINRLSGGEQQRVAIARAISTNCDIILADEPTGNLDKKTQKEIIEVFQRLAHVENKCVIVVTHSHDVAKGSDIVLKMQDGKIK